MSELTYRAESLRRRVSIVEVFERMGEHFQGGAHTKWRRGKVMSSLVVNTQDNTWARYKYADQHGDIFDLVMLTEQCTFAEAIELVEQGHFGRLNDLPSAQLPVTTFVQPDLPQDLHLKYHRNLDELDRTWWAAQGVNAESISRFWLGSCPYHDLWQQPTMTIPIIVAGKLVNVRHRLVHPPKTGDKYRPERAGLPMELFNSDILTPDLAGVIIMAGEKKVLVAWQYHLPAVSTTGGCGFWLDEFTTRLQFCRKVYVCFDPGEGEAAERLAQRIGERVWIVDLPEKPDDFLTRIAVEQDAAAAEAAFREYLRKARPYVNREVWAQRNGGSQWGKTRALPR
jgi:hypothetical protein